MSKKSKNSQNRSPADGVVRVVTDDTSTIQSSAPAETFEVLDPVQLQVDGFSATLQDVLIEPGIVDESSAAPMATATVEDTTANTATLDDAFLEPPEPVTMPSENLPALQAVETTGISTNAPSVLDTPDVPTVLDDVFNPKIWALEAELKRALARSDELKAELARAFEKNARDIADALSSHEAQLDQLRKSKLWHLQIHVPGQPGVTHLVVATDAMVAIHKILIATGTAIEYVKSIKPIADRVIL